MYYEDEFDRIEDDVDYSAIAYNEWEALGDQLNLPPSSSSISNVGGSSTSRLSHRDERTLGAQQATTGAQRSASESSEPTEFEQGSSRTSSSVIDSAILQSAVTSRNTITRRRSDTGSSTYFSEDNEDLDSSFLEQLDRLEREVIDSAPSSTFPHSHQSHVTQTHQASTSGIGTTTIHPTIMSSTYSRTTDPHPHHYPYHSNLNHLKADPSTETLKRPCSCSPSSAERPSPSKKGKTKENGDIEELFDGLDDELGCPICFDILVGAQLINPCGHTLCGPCGYTWFTLKKNATCPVCRTKCCHFKPLVPNIMVDSLAEKYIEIRVASGDKTWALDGVKRKEWNERVEKWKMNVNCTKHYQKSQKRAVVSVTQMGSRSRVVDPDLLFGIRALEDPDRHGPRNILEILGVRRD